MSHHPFLQNFGNKMLADVRTSANTCQTCFIIKESWDTVSWKNTCFDVCLEDIKLLIKWNIFPKFLYFSPTGRMDFGNEFDQYTAFLQGIKIRNFVVEKLDDITSVYYTLIHRIIRDGWFTREEYLSNFVLNLRFLNVVNVMLSVTESGSRKILSMQLQLFKYYPIMYNGRMVHFSIAHNI